MNYPDTMLSKILGVYEIKIGTDSPYSFFVTENMMSCDLSKLKYCFDLKGSIHGREEDHEPYESGLKVLKDVNFLNDYYDRVDMEEHKKS